MGQKELQEGMKRRCLVSRITGAQDADIKKVGLDEKDEAIRTAGTRGNLQSSGRATTFAFLPKSNSSPHTVKSTQKHSI